METQLHMITVYHPQIDGQSDRMIQTLEDMLHAYVTDLDGNWDEHLSLAEFIDNNSYHARIEMAPYEALYSRKCSTPLCWDKAGERRPLVPKLVQQMTEKVD